MCRLRAGLCRMATTGVAPQPCADGRTCGYGRAGGARRAGTFVVCLLQALEAGGEAP